MKNNSIDHENSKIKQLYKNIFFYFTKNRKIFILFIFLSVIIFSFSFFLVKRSNYIIVYKNLSERYNVQKVFKQLKSLKIPYKYSFQYDFLSIPSDKIDVFYAHLNDMHLNNENLPGFELLDQEKFGSSSFLEEINYQRALEGELSRTIEKFHAVQSARVHLVCVKNTPFLDKDSFSSAAVFITIDKSIQSNIHLYYSIICLLSNSIFNLKKENITIVNQYCDVYNGDDKIFQNNPKFQHIDFHQCNKSHLIEKKKCDLDILNACNKMPTECYFFIEEKLRSVYNIKGLNKKEFFNLKKNNVNFFKNNNFNIQLLQGSNKKNVIHTRSLRCQIYDVLKEKIKSTQFLHITGVRNNSIKYQEKDNFLDLKSFLNINTIMKKSINFARFIRESFNILHCRFFNTNGFIFKNIPVEKDKYLKKKILLFPWFLMFFFAVLFMTSFVSFKKFMQKIKNNKKVEVIHDFTQYYQNKNMKEK
ncbi:hypothetical protein [Buchnera aphidicola]|uniref:hypothetical protein n=1 Tax=Buchnera aphidicola TaxID=9 RepID=UPI0020930151|nr:hypothetical protein [Buchnera aphidicola]USS94184.1 hypothetical protein M3Y47_01980 [Buchnera aphidicola (Sipha maydis)]